MFTSRYVFVNNLFMSKRLLELFFKPCSVSLNKTYDNTAGTENYYWWENKDSAVHKEVLRQDHNNTVGVGIEEPVILTGEEDLMEYGKCHVEIKRHKTADKRKATESVRTRTEGYIHSEGTPKLKYAELFQYQQSRYTYEWNNKCGRIKVE